MKIVNVTPGIIPIPPNGWGAVEKIIWETHQNLLKLGHDSHITYLDDVPLDADIVHIHVANLANMAYDQGIPYYFTMHDHHAYLNGKDSFIYQENLLAMKRSIRSFVPAKYLIEYFENIPEYFSHGVNTEYFIPSGIKEHKLLCVANNGYAHDQTVDRKGFTIAIEAARKLNLPITIAGPSNNKNYFNANPSTYDKLTILYDLNEEELLTVYKNHSIFVHASELEAGHPNLTLLEALSSGLPIVGTLESNNSLEGMVVVPRDTQSVINGVQAVISNHTQFSTAARAQAEALSWENRTKELINVYTSKRLINMKEQLKKHYSTTTPLNKAVRPDVRINCIDGMFVEILGNVPKKYEVKFINKKNNLIMFSTVIENNCWARTAIKHYVDWKIEIKDLETQQVFVYQLDLTNKKVYIAIDSKSLGDTLAWIPYVEEFRKKHKCTVVCSTFWNKFFTEAYKDITFVEPGETVHNLTAMYKIGIYFKEDLTIDFNMNPVYPMANPLQRTCSDILGLDFMEIKPKMKQPTVEKNDKQVAIAIHSTAQSKYWNNPTGWQEVVDWLVSKGYTVKLLSNEEDGYMGNPTPNGIVRHTDGSIESVIEELKRSKLFIGISSGLSWLSWAVNTPVMMISGFTEPSNEMQDCIRIYAPKGVCAGCWSRHRFDPGDWNWCPDHKNTPRQFECSKQITGEMVIKELEKVL